MNFNNNSGNIKGIINDNSKNYYAPVQKSNGDINNYYGKETDEISAKCEAVPVWRSPFTLAVLTWISCILTLPSIFSFYKIIKNIIQLLKGGLNVSTSIKTDLYTWIFLFIVFFLILLVNIQGRRIARKQTIHPLICNYAISGIGQRLIVNKMKINLCPQCGGKMRYYNKPIEWEETIDDKGNHHRKVTKRIPVIECKRNSEHYWYVDPAMKI